MWECPDFFDLDGKWVLMTSPQDMLIDGNNYHSGLDFYATQTTLAPDGRRIMIGWMQN